MILLGAKTQAVVFDGAVIDDGFGRFMKVLALLGSLATLVMGQDFLARERIDKFEFPILVILATIGMLVLISAQNLIALYLGLELMSLALYVIAAFNRDNVRASEAGLKYFVLGALSSGMLLYGLADLRLCRNRILRRHRWSRARQSFDRDCVRPSLPDDGPCIQDVGGAVPYVDAGRL